MGVCNVHHKVNGLFLCLVVILPLLWTPCSSNALYHPKGPIVQLTSENFYQLVLNTSNVWFIEFYADWCAHCRRFAPIYKRVAEEVKEWGHVVKIGAVSCSHQPNVAFCRQMRITTFPTLRFYPAYLKSRNYKGQKYIGSSAVSGLVNAIIDYVSGTQAKPRSWPFIDRVSSVRDILSRSSPDVTITLAVVEKDADHINEYEAKKLLFDLSGLPKVNVMRLRRSDMNSGVYQIQQDGTLTLIKEGVDRKKLREVTFEVVRRRTTEETYHYPTPSAATIGQIPLEITHNIQRQKARVDNSPSPTPRVRLMHTSTSGLHLQDLESSLYQSLWLEVGASYNISGPQLRVLHNYIGTLSRYFPGTYYLMGFLHKLDLWLQGVTTWITGEQWVQALNKLQSGDAYIPERVRWTGCAGSTPAFRGYTCSLWQTFHALTVNALETNLRNPQYDSREVLLNIREYVHHFMRCRECATHFAIMARGIEREVRRPRDGTLWLWRAHNSVNKHLAGDETDDPYHPKTAFPTVSQCPTCRMSQEGRRGRSRQLSNNDNNLWNDEEVLFFLRRFYGQDFVIPDSLPYTFPVASKSPPIFIPPETDFLTNAELTETEQVTEKKQPLPNVQQTIQTQTTISTIKVTIKTTPQVPTTRTTKEPFTHRQPQTHNFRTPQPWTPRPWTPKAWTVKQHIVTAIPIYPRPQIYIPKTYTLQPQWTPQPWSQPAPEVQTPQPWRKQVQRANSNRSVLLPREITDNNQGEVCPGMNTQWSACSASCDVGVSMRTVGYKPSCVPKTESRMCQMRPCNYRFTTNQWSPCGSTYQSANYLPLVFGKCRSTQYLKWRYCGECPGKCCRPAMSYTKEMTFRCESEKGEKVTAYASVEIVKICECADCI